MTRPRPVFLLTDFGAGGHYQGIMRAVIAARAPGAAIHDLGHGIAAGRIGEGAYVLAAAFPYLPEDAVVAAVVDPGVGGGRRVLALRRGRRTVLAPDNGLVTPLLDLPGAAELRAVRRPDLELPERSATFHGRDVFAPLAAALANGLDEASLGPVIADAVRFEPPPKRVGGDAALGQVLAVDPFGNLVTDLTREDLAALALGGRCRVAIGAAVIDGILATYSQAPPDGLLAYFGSSGHLEVAVRDGNAARALGASPGAPVRVERERPGSGT